MRVREGGGWAEAVSLKVRGNCVLKENLGWILQKFKRVGFEYRVQGGYCKNSYPTQSISSFILKTQTQPYCLSDQVTHEG